MSDSVINSTGAANHLLPFFLGPTWHAALAEELLQPYFLNLLDFLAAERQLHAIFPAEANVFNAFSMTPFDAVKVVLVGQDPYHGPGQADGLSFSVPKGMALPPSLRNIFRELEEDLGLKPPRHGSLYSWAAQGVLLLNTTLTVRQGEPLSHAGKGWERFTDAVVEKLVERENPPIFVLWGKCAQSKWSPFMDRGALDALFAAHPSPFSAYRGFFGCRHFSKINQILEGQGQKRIDWQLRDSPNQ